MKKSAFLSDILFAFSVAMVFTLCLFRFLGVTLIPALLLSAVCGVLAAGAVWAILQSKRKSVFLKKSDAALQEKLLLHLVLLSDEQKTAYLQKLLSLKDGSVKRFSKSRLVGTENFYFLHFKFSPVTADEVASAARLKTSKNKILLCNEIEETAKKLCEKLGFEVKTGEAVYALAKAENALPDEYLGEVAPENKRKRRLRLCFAKSNGKRFFVCGALVLLTSLLTPFPYYYLIFGSILLLAAVFIRIFGYS